MGKTATNQNVRVFVSPTGNPVRSGWHTESSPRIANFSAVAFYFGRDLAKNLGVTVGLIQAAVGGTRLALWRRGRTWHRLRIAPLIPYGLRGTIWYQGEADTSGARWVDYASRFQAMIREWREDLGQGDFPFLYVQLPRYTRRAPQWMYVREAQLDSLSAPNTAMACTIDIVSTGGIHPTFKLPVGQRLALAARRLAHGQTVVYSGPLFDPQKTRIAGNRIVVGFRHVGTGLIAAGGAVTGFEIAGRNRAFVPAVANILGDTVVVSSAKVSRPEAVRYGWALSPKVNLLNKEGLPASPFRSDATYWRFGTSCGKSPAPSLQATLMPRSSRPFELRIDHLRVGKPGLLFTGLSDRTWGGLPLPADLSRMGMTGCKLFASGEVQIGFVANAVGAFDFRIAVPRTAGLLGVVFFNQALVVVPAANRIGVAVTNAGRGQIGAR